MRLGPLTLTRMVEMNADRETSAPLGCLVHDRQMIARLHQSKLRNKRQRRKMCSSKGVRRLDCRVREESRHSRTGEPRRVARARGCRAQRDGAGACQESGSTKVSLTSCAMRWRTPHAHMLAVRYGAMVQEWQCKKALLCGVGRPDVHVQSHLRHHVMAARVRSGEVFLPASTPI